MLALANIVAIFHAFVLLALIAGPALLFRAKRNRALERGFIIIGGLTALSFVITGACFLTTWEKYLRTAAGAESYTGGYVRHYLGTIGIEIPDIATTIVIITLITIGFARILWLRRKGK